MESFFFFGVEFELDWEIRVWVLWVCSNASVGSVKI